MSELNKDYFDYPHRSYGMDHNRYDWSMLADRPKTLWPDGKLLALWVNVGLQFFPLNQKGVPFKVPGGMTKPYPDLRHYSLRDYGNRVGIYRFLKAFDRFDVKSTFAISTRLAERTPYLIDRIKERGDEIICHGYHMDALHYGGQDQTEEAEIVKRALDGLRTISGQTVRGWLSPAKNESPNTPDLLTQNDITYFCDWVNDEMPYPFATQKGSLVAMPLSTELEDYHVILNNQHSAESWAEQVCDACDFLIQDAQTNGGRILSLNIHPWVLGQPHRIAQLEKVLEYISSKKEVWSAYAGEILDAWKS